MQCCCTDMNCYIAYLIYDTVKNVIIKKKKNVYLWWIYLIIPAIKSLLMTKLD